MTYTIKTASWGNEDKSSAIINTEEVGHVAISAADTPDEWQNLLQWEALGGRVRPLEESTAYQKQQAEETRRTTYLSDPDRIDVLNRLRTATAAQIRTYVDNNVTNVAGAREMLKRILILIALDARS